MNINFGEPDAVAELIHTENGKKIGAFPADGGVLIVVLNEEDDTLELYALTSEIAQSLADSLHLRLLDEATDWDEEVA